MPILIVAEKPNVARAISPVVGATKNNKGYTEGNGYIVSWCVGHLVGLKYPNDYGNGWENKWSFSQLPMIPEQWQFQVSNSTKAQFNVLKDLMNRSEITEIVCATDADREGECIFRYVYNMTKSRKPVKRLWVSSLEESAIRSALNCMKPMSDYDNLYNAGFARAKSDWLVGMNGSRLFTCRYGGTLNIGRVQTPTLAMIVQRDAEVKGFVKQKYFTVDLDCGFKAVSDRIDDEITADSLVSACNGTNAVVTEVKKEIKTVNPPKLFDLTSLQREANNKFGYTAQQTMEYMQSLYEAKLVTYPRTDSQYLTTDMHDSTLAIIPMLSAKFGFGTVVNADITACINNKKVTGHHAIIPTETVSNADISALSKGEHNILKLVALRLLCASDSAHKYESVRIRLACANTLFSASGKTVIEMGWKAHDGKVGESEKEEETSLPSVYEGQFINCNASKSEHFTSPPKPYTEDTLLSAMEHAGAENFDTDAEKKGLGTPATRAATIEGLVKNGYAERKGKQISATEKGVNLIHVVPDEVKSPVLTADWENQLLQVERGEITADSFMSEIESFIRSLCSKYAATDSSVSFGNSESLGKCLKCGSDIVNGKYGYYCKGKCGMNVAKVYGVTLTESQLRGLLSGKSCSYKKNGKETVVLPKYEQNEYNGKTCYQWVTERGNANGKK